MEFDERILFPEEDEILCPVYTVPLNEFRLRDFCREKGIVCYLPLHQTWKVNDYLKRGKPYHQSQLVLRPMFPSYVFVKLPADGGRSLLYESKAALRILAPSSQERFIEDVRAIRSIELVGLEQEVEFNADIRIGDHFIIESGVWTGVTGWLKKKGKRFSWTVELEIVNQLVRTTIDPSQFEMRKII